MQSIGRRNISEALHREVLVPRSSPFCWWGRRHSQRRSCSQDTQQYISLVQDGRLSMSSSVCAPARRIRRVHWDAMIFAYVLAVLKSGSEEMIYSFGLRCGVRLKTTYLEPCANCGIFRWYGRRDDRRVVLVDCRKCPRHEFFWRVVLLVGFVNFRRMQGVGDPRVTMGVGSRGDEFSLGSKSVRVSSDKVDCAHRKLART